MNEHSSDEDQLLVVNYENIISDPEFPEYVVRTCKYVRQHTYITVEEFLSQLSDDELLELMQHVENVTEEGADLNVKSYRLLIVLTSILISAEGTLSLTQSEVEQNMKALIMFVTLEVLYRDGVIEINRSNMAFNEKENEVIARAK